MQKITTYQKIMFKKWYIKILKIPCYSFPIKSNAKFPIHEPR